MSAAELLLEWFDAVARDLPWRGLSDPYGIWVSEIMLQQTQVATVIPYYERFMARFPTVSELAAAEESELFRLWEGLGYYSRARNLQKAARQVVSAHGGRFPASVEALRALPGVGEYTAGAVGSIAFGLPVPAVDGNAIRVLSRLLLEDADVSRPETRRRLHAGATALLPADRPGDFNQAVMELGATICVPATPRCERCPLESRCRARAAGREAELPVKSPRRAPRALTLAACLVEKAGRHLLVRRPEKGIWAGLWAFPTAEAETAGALASALESAGLRLQVHPVPVATLHHQLTHRTLTIPVFRALHLGGEPEESRWVAPEALAEQALPRPFRKLATELERGSIHEAW